MDNDGIHLKFHHLGLMAEKPDKALKFLKTLGYQNGRPVLDPVQNVNLMLCTHPASPTVEIICPTDSKGPLDNLIKAHHELIYHVAYETGNLAETLEQLQKQKHRLICVSEPKPAVLFSGCHVAFYRVVGFGLVEFIEIGR